METSGSSAAASCSPACWPRARSIASKSPWSRFSQDAQDRREAQLTLRVPSDHLAAALKTLRQLGEVRQESVSTQDVTKEYADLDTRLAVKQQTVARLRSLIDNRTAKLADVLEVERELARAVTEMEEMKGERRYYDQ